MQANSYDSPGTTGGNLENVMPELSIIAPERTPFVSSIKTASASSTFTEVVADTLRAARIAGRREGKNFTGGSNKAANRQRFGVYVQQFGDEWGVSATQQAVSRKGGVATNDDEAGAAKSKMLREVKTDMEAFALSNQEAQGGSDDEMRTRGAIAWVRASLQTAAIAVPTAFMPTTGNAGTAGVGTITNAATTDSAVLTEAQVRMLLRSVHDTYGEKKELDLYAGSNLCSTFDVFLHDSPAIVTSNTVVRSANVNGADHTISFWVSIYDSAFARVNIINNQFVNFSATSTSGDSNAGALINPELWELQWLEEMVTRDMTDEGGGDWGWSRGQCALLCRNPKGNGAILTS